MADTWSLGKHTFTSRLLIGTGKYKDFPCMQQALVASGAELVTVAVRRLDLSKKGAESLLEWIPKQMTLLPNTAACFTAEEAIRTARLGRELDMGDLVKLEVIGDKRTLFPDVEGLVQAAKVLVKEGFGPAPSPPPRRWPCRPPRPPGPGPSPSPSRCECCRGCGCRGRNRWERRAASPPRSPRLRASSP